MSIKEAARRCTKRKKKNAGETANCGKAMKMTRYLHSLEMNWKIDCRAYEVAGNGTNFHGKNSKQLWGARETFVGGASSIPVQLGQGLRV
jgi:hypothetical protein